MSLVKGQIASPDTGGIFNPTLTGDINITSVQDYGSYYIRVGNIVIVFTQIYVTPVTNSSASFIMTTPVTYTWGGGFDVIGMSTDVSGVSITARTNSPTNEVDVNLGNINGANLVKMTYSYHL